MGCEACVSEFEFVSCCHCCACVSPCSCQRACLGSVLGKRCYTQLPLQHGGHPPSCVVCLWICQSVATFDLCDHTLSAPCCDTC